MNVIPDPPASDEGSLHDPLMAYLTLTYGPNSLLQAVGPPDEVSWWDMWTAEPVQRDTPTPHLILRRGHPLEQATWLEPRAKDFAGFQYRLFGVEVPARGEDAYYWGTVDDRHTVRILQLLITHPAFPQVRALVVHPWKQAPLPLLYGLSPEPSGTEWRCAHKAWRLLTTFKQETRGRREGKVKYPTRASFVAGIHALYHKVDAGNWHHLLPIAEAWQLADWLDCGTTVLNKRCREHGITLDDIRQRRV
jgi:hypothetical protein